MAKRIKRFPDFKRSVPIISRFKKFGNPKVLKLRVKNLLRRAGVVVDKKPLTSFFVVLDVLLAIIACLSFSGIIMLFFIPVMYYIVYKRDYEKRN